MRLGHAGFCVVSINAGGPSLLSVKRLDQRCQFRWLRPKFPTKSVSPAADRHVEHAAAAS